MSDSEGGDPVDFTVVVNERQVLALLTGMGLFIGRSGYFAI